MDIILGILETASFGTVALTLVCVLLGAFYVFHVIPRFKEHDELKEKYSQLEATVASTRIQLDRANDLVKDHVSNSKTEHQLIELLKTCQLTQTILAEYVRRAESDVTKLSDELDDLYDKIQDMIRDNSRDGTGNKLQQLDSEMRMMSQQLANVSNRLSSVIGILVGNSPNRSMAEDLIHERQLK